MKCPMNERQMRYALFIFLFVPGRTFSQGLQEDSRVVVKTADKTEAILYSTADCPQCYYYLPVALRLSKKPGGIPEVSLVTWQNESGAEISGGIFHFLVEWGLTRGNEREIREFLRLTHDSSAVVMGPAAVTAVAEGNIIVGDDNFSQMLRKCLQSGSASTATPGAKMAFSFRFTEKEINDFMEGVKNPGKVKTRLHAAYSYELMGKWGQHVQQRIVLSMPLKEIVEQIHK